MLKSLLFIPLFIYFFAVTPDSDDSGRCKETSKGMAIDWEPNQKLIWSDFRSVKKVGKGFSIAASTCGFGYDGVIKGNEIKVNVNVRFYCKDSWRNPDFDMADVLEHEQLHFDICELYGRKFYKGITDLRKKNRLDERNLLSLYDSLVQEYDKFQDKYDDETNHSTIVSAQKRWNTDIAQALDKLNEFSEYTEF